MATISKFEDLEIWRYGNYPEFCVLKFLKLLKLQILKTTLD